MKYIEGIGAFWYDFIVGDSWVLAVGGAAVLALGFALARLDADVIAEVVLPLAVAGTLIGSLLVSDK